tara:strand:+ start:43 stop:171 length:129 start_codon:yes stop_codon:yes gene_type:complete
MNNRKGCVMGTKLYNDKYGKNKSDKKEGAKEKSPYTKKKYGV